MSVVDIFVSIPAGAEASGRWPGPGTGRDLRRLVGQSLEKEGKYRVSKKRCLA